jgi:hypothetical protein
MTPAQPRRRIGRHRLTSCDADSKPAKGNKSYLKTANSRNIIGNSTSIKITGKIQTERPRHLHWELTGAFLRAE